MRSPYSTHRKRPNKPKPKTPSPALDTSKLEILISPSDKKKLNKIAKLKATIDEQRLQITRLEAKNAELRVRFMARPDQERYERWIRDLRRELDQRNRVIAELRSKYGATAS
jgi:predicted RNase H-like nuclease (RuvC/YqgF family)